MTLNRERKVTSVLLAAVALLFAFGMMQCNEDSKSTSNGEDYTKCVVHEECPIGFSCQQDEGICLPDAKAEPCDAFTVCPTGYQCYIDPASTDGLGKCIPIATTDPDGDKDAEQDNTQVPCTIDADCPQTPDEQICISSVCVLLYGTCTTSEDCFDGQICNVAMGKCEALPADGDEDTQPEDGDTAEVDQVDGDTEETSEPVDGDVEPGCGECQRNSDCTDETKPVCGPCGKCMAFCDQNDPNACPDGAHCNPNNGMCEFCEEMCAPGRCCNYAEDFWYCGSCCVPPCEDNQACQGGSCVDLTCPTCEVGETCGPDTGYICVGEAVDGDGAETTAETCLPANAACTDGVDTCCSGTCLMGTCL